MKAKTLGALTTLLRSRRSPIAGQLVAQFRRLVLRSRPPTAGVGLDPNTRYLLAGTTASVVGALEPENDDMDIRYTLDDGSFRASAILQTQHELQEAVARNARDLGQIVALTLVETSAGVRTIRAIVERHCPMPDVNACVNRLIGQALALGLGSVARGLQIELEAQMPDGPSLAHRSDRRPRQGVHSTFASRHPCANACDLNAVETARWAHHCFAGDEIGVP